MLLQPFPIPLHIHKGCTFVQQYTLSGSKGGKEFQIAWTEFYAHIHSSLYNGLPAVDPSLVQSGFTSEQGYSLSHM